MPAFAGLQIPVHDAGAMRAVERVGHLNPDGERVGERQRASGDAVAERLAFEELHDQEANRVIDDG